MQPGHTMAYMWPRSGPARADRLLQTGWVVFLSGLVLLISTQFILRDPRSLILPSTFLNHQLCKGSSGPIPNQPSNPGSHSGGHCPLCLIQSFSDGQVRLVLSLPVRVLHPLYNLDSSSLEAVPGRTVELPRIRAPPA